MLDKFVKELKNYQGKRLSELLEVESAAKDAIRLTLLEPSVILSLDQAVALCTEILGHVSEVQKGIKDVDYNGS